MGLLGKINRVIKRFRGDNKGAIATEFALVLPVYLGIIILVIEVGRIAYIKTAITHAAEEATRFSLVNDTATVDDIQAKALTSLIGLDLDNLSTIVVTAPVDADDQTRLITVVINFQYVPITPIGFFLDQDEGGFQLVGESRGFLAEEITVL